MVNSSRSSRARKRRHDDWLAVVRSSCMVHVFSPDGRERYNLEELWASGDEVVHNAPERLTIDTIGSSPRSSG